MMGVHGGLTIFSSFSLQAPGLIHAGAMGRAPINVDVPVPSCPGSVTAGHMVVSALNGITVQATKNGIEEKASQTMPGQRQ